MKQEPIATTKAAFKKQFAMAMKRNGISPEDYFEKVGLPTQDQEDPESLLPEKPFWRLINLVAVNEGIADFGAQVAQMIPWHKIESMTPLICNSKNLEELLTDFCKIASGQSSIVRFMIEKDETSCWFSCTNRPLIKNDIQMELYRITSMIQFIQLAAGSGWYPDKVELLMPRTENVKVCQLLKKSHITFYQPSSRIAFPRILLKLPVNLNIKVTSRRTSQYNINADFIGTLRQIIGIYISSNDCKIETIARATEIPVRTLQRRLKKHDLCFNDLLNQAKFRLAREKLEKTSLSISEISSRLGYSDQAHFNRAFYRWTDMSPSQFRTTCGKPK